MNNYFIAFIVISSLLVVIFYLLYQHHKSLKKMSDNVLDYQIQWVDGFYVDSARDKRIVFEKLIKKTDYLIRIYAGKFPDDIFKDIKLLSGQYFPYFISLWIYYVKSDHCGKLLDLQSPSLHTYCIPDYKNFKDSKAVILFDNSYYLLVKNDNRFYIGSDERNIKLIKKFFTNITDDVLSA